MIPNIIHFVFIHPLRFGFVHYVAIVSAFKVHKPDKIYVYVDQEPDGKYWEFVKQYVTVEVVDLPLPDVPYAAYKADVIRIEKLIDRGGIYIDVDSWSLKSLGEFRDQKAVMFGNSTKSGDEPLDPLHVRALPNALMMFEPEDPFLKDWRAKMESYIEVPYCAPGNKYNWGHHAVGLPAEMLQEDAKKDQPAYGHIHVLNDMRLKFGTYHQHPPLLIKDPHSKPKVMRRFNMLNVFHFWNTIQYDVNWAKLTEYNYADMFPDTLFEEVCQPYAEELKVEIGSRYPGHYEEDQRALLYFGELATERLPVMSGLPADALNLDNVVTSTCYPFFEEGDIPNGTKVLYSNGKINQLQERVWDFLFRVSNYVDRKISIEERGRLVCISKLYLLLDLGVGYVYTDEARQILQKRFGDFLYIEDVSSEGRYVYVVMSPITRTAISSPNYPKLVYF